MHEGAVRFSLDQKLAGVLEPVFAIRTEDDLGIGDTEGARQMIDWCHARGLNIFQTLPLNETSDDNSPYNAISALAIDPVTLALSPRTIADLTGEDFARVARPALVRSLRRGAVNYPKVKALKRALLEAAFENFSSRHFDRGTERAGEFRRFIGDNAAWLADYALFRVLMDENGGQHRWRQWPAEQQTPAAATAWLLSLPAARRDGLERRRLYFMYAQWLAFTQWEALKRYGEDRKVFLMGDIPFGVSVNSADVWANPDVFDLDWSGGAPPEKFFKVDAFTERWGQNWGIADCRWEEMKRTHFRWWRRRVENVARVFHLCRIDHAPGFFRIYSFPWPPEQNHEFVNLDEKAAAALTGGRLPGFKPYPDDTFEHQAANQKHGEEVLRVVLEAAGGMVIVAEDLGMVPEYARPTLRKLGIPGYHIPSFFREADGSYSDPAGYPRLSLAQPATHDHPPLAAAWADFWRSIDQGKTVAGQRQELHRIMAFAGVKSKKAPRAFTDRLREGFLRALLCSNSWLAVVMITDVLGQTIRFNTPGSLGADNWSQRLRQTVRELESDRVSGARAQAFARAARDAGRGC